MYTRPTASKAVCVRVYVSRLGWTSVHRISFYICSIFDLFNVMHVNFVFMYADIIVKLARVTAYCTFKWWLLITYRMFAV